MTNKDDNTERFKYANEAEALIRRVARDTKNRRFDWSVIKVSELPVVEGEGGTIDEQQAASARKLLKSRPDAPVRFGPGRDLAAVWMLEGEPTSEPEFPEPIGTVTKKWAMVPKSILDRRMPLGMRANDADYTKLALQHYGRAEDDFSTPVRLYANSNSVAVWLHKEEPTSEPEWPEEKSASSTM